MNTFEKLSLLEDDWNSYGAPAPNDLAIYRTKDFIQQLELYNLPYSNIAPSTAGGICVSFGKDKYDGDLEFFNDGDIMGMIMFGEKPIIHLICDHKQTYSIYQYERIIWVSIQLMKIAMGY